MLDEVARWLFDPSGLTPHGFCLLWEPGLLWLHALSDIGIGLAYFTIPLALAVFVRRRRDLAFRPVFWLFAAFILLCGAGHWLDVVTLWVPAYGVEGLVKATTAIVSMITAVALWRLLPQALALPSPAQLRDANAALLASEDRYRASFQESPVPLVTVDTDGLILGVSKSWSALLGYAEHDVIGRHISSFAEPGSASWRKAEIAVLHAHGEIQDMERRFVCADGRVLDTLVSSRLQRGADAPLIVSVMIDITARRRAEAALRASEARLRQAQKMEAVGQLTGGIAHDFNNMLQSIASSLELMETRIEQRRPAEAARHVGVARQSVVRAAGLTHRMLAFARRQALNPRPVDTAALVRGIAELIRRTVGPGIGLVLRLGNGGWPALCDANQLESALLNLAINARDAMPDGGTLTIATADRHLTRADLSDQDGAEPGDYVELSVTDTGIGMTPDVMARAFEPFFTTKPIGQGTGLGLSQIYGFARQSGGFVRLDSKPGEGATFRLYLPRDPLASAISSAVPDEAAAPMAEPESEIVPDPAGVGVGTVLVVEDEPAVRAQIAEALRECGCVVLEAGDGPAGLLLVKANGRLDMLVTDVGLPGLNGRQLADAARASRPGLPVLLITGYAGTALEDMALSPGLEVIAKPFALGSLTARVCALLEASLVR
jgi:PAS domain S-box-containing protein